MPGAARTFAVVCGRALTPRRSTAREQVGRGGGRRRRCPVPLAVSAAKSSEGRHVGGEAGLVTLELHESRWTEPFVTLIEDVALRAEEVLFADVEVTAAANRVVVSS